MILAVIPARGGSKRFPRKNIAPFGGKPLLVWSIILAQHLSTMVRSVVSTEDAEIAAVARRAGADVIDRPADLAGDESAMVDVLIHAAETIRMDGSSFAGVMLLQPTNPLRPVDLIKEAIARFSSEPCDSLISISRRPLKIGQVAGGVFTPSNPPHTQSRHLPPVFYENGLLYLTKTKTLMEKRGIYGDRALAFETPRPYDDVDIDDPIDVEVGEAILTAVSRNLGYG
jgi:N-acylneuraminate cytidylyltransferase